MFKTFKFWNELFIMIIGLIVGAAAVYYFLVPSKIIIGTVSGLAMVLNSLVPFIKVSQFVLILNVILRTKVHSGFDFPRTGNGSV